MFAQLLLCLRRFAGDAVCVVVCGLLSGAALAQAGGVVQTPSVSFPQAWEQLQTQSHGLAASAKAVEGTRLRREGMQGLGGPSVAITGMVYRYKAHVDMDLDPARHSLDGVLGQLPPVLGGVTGQLPQLPSHYSLQRSDSRASASLSLLWPLYLGGAAEAVRGGLDAQTDEALADARGDALALHRLLVERYFGAQLAQRAAQLRQQALDAVRQHDAAAQKMLQAGVLSEVERLQARAALADVQQQASQAHDLAQLAATALARTLQAAGPFAISSPLFVGSQPLPPLQHFLGLAQQHHPGLAKVRAKRGQAGALHDTQEALRKPQVLGFGMREVNTQGKPSWVVGVAARWTLWDSIDRDRLAAASQRSMEQAELTEQQARSDIALLVEKNWLAVEHARQLYLSQQAQQELAQALLRLRQAGLREGTATTLELMDAELNLAKVGTERAQTANQYVQSLAELLQACGQSEDFVRYQAQADILIPTDTTITPP